MSYFGIGIYQPKHEENVGTLFRGAQAFGASFIFTIGRKYSRQSSDTSNSTNYVPYFYYVSIDDFVKNLPKECQPICVENNYPKCQRLEMFTHPEKVVYILGNEVHGIHTKLLDKYPSVLIPSKICLNVSAAGHIVMYDRIQKQKLS